MDAIAHTQVSAVCLVTLAVLLRAQQKMRDKSLPGRLFTALLWSAGALTIVDHGSALAQLGVDEQTAAEDACKAEHILSEQTLEKIRESALRNDAAHPQAK